MSERPLILLTNDDGIAAPGLRALLEVCRQLGEVLVVAPDSPQSGQGHAITLEDPLRLYPVDLFEGIEAYECSGTPADCVKLAKYKIHKTRPISLCVSGINHGSNAGVNVIYSGTMSAAMEASIDGIPSIGFSLLDYKWEADFSAAKPWVRSLIAHALSNGIAPANLLNVNIPYQHPEGIRGLRVCRQANARWVEEFQEGEDPRGRPYYWLTGKYVPDDVGPGTDAHALEEGYISVVPCKHDLTDYNALEAIDALEKLS